MTKKAWVLNGNLIKDVCQGGDPFEHYHPEIAALYTVDVPDNVENGWELQENGTWGPYIPKTINVVSPPSNESLPEILPPQPINPNDLAAK
jgi:hypothetical protein